MLVDNMLRDLENDMHQVGVCGNPIIDSRINLQPYLFLIPHRFTVDAPLSIC